MNWAIEQTITHYYPRRALVSPLDDASITWEYDPKYETLKAVLADLKQLDPELRPGTRASYDVSEEVILFDRLHLQLSYVGPFAALNYRVEEETDEVDQERSRRIREVVERHGLRLLESQELGEAVPWIQHGLPSGTTATVWDCLFLNELKSTDGPVFWGDRAK
jgi:hypothetical protein